MGQSLQCLVCLWRKKCDDSIDKEIFGKIYIHWLTKKIISTEKQF